MYQALNNIDANGQYTNYTLGNAKLVATASYRHDSGTMKEVKVTRSGTTLHHHRYLTEDAFMNLTYERNEMTGMEKRYSYDDLHRLTHYQVTQGSPSQDFTVNYAYDAVGNLLQKSDYANSYHYANSSQCAQTTHPANGVCQVTKLDGSQVSFDYDARGNMTTGDSLTMTYNAMDKPLTVNGKGTQTRFTYGPNQMRHKQVRTTNGETTTTHYLDKLYEIDLETNHWRAYIGDAAQLAWTQDNGLQLLFTLKDRLGSATTLVNQDGQLISRRYFDPFGKSASELPSSLDTVSFGMSLSEFRFTDLTETNRYRRGFTGHEHLNEQQLIHMNGRIYDYNLGRFMSVDPVIQSPANTQSVNPYSYIMNNPLAGTDPTGYTAETDTVQVEQKDQFFKDGDGNIYLDKGGDTLIKVDSVTIANSNGTSSTTSFGSGGAVADISFTNDKGITFTASEIGSQVDVANTSGNREGTTGVANDDSSLESSGTSGLQASFNDEQLGNIAGFLKDEDYAGAYGYILGEIQGLDGVDADTKYWFEKAIEINLNQDTPANTWIRAFTTKGLAIDGITATPEMLQGISNSIAQNVISDVLRSGGVPQFNQLVVADIRVALSNGGQTIGGWGGSSHFWNLPYGSNNETVGQLIKGSPYELNKFRQSYSHAVKSVFGRHGFGAAKEAARTLNMGAIKADLACGTCLFEF